MNINTKYQTMEVESYMGTKNGNPQRRVKFKDNKFGTTYRQDVEWDSTLTALGLAIKLCGRLGLRPVGHVVTDVGVQVIFRVGRQYIELLKKLK